MSVKVATVVGARPQFIKAAAVSRVMRNNGSIEEVLVHTGQHYDANMSKIFFDELDIPHPQYNLGIGGIAHGAMTGRMIEGIEKVLLAEKPDWVLVYGDTNSTLAGALAAVKLHIPIAHVEAGLRSFNLLGKAEEVNRVLTDRIASLLFCPTETAVKNLAAENIVKGVQNSGDVMYDASLFYRDRAREKSDVLERFGLKDRQYSLATYHRAENTDDPHRLRSITEALAELSRQERLVLPLHPRTRKILMREGLMRLLNETIMVDPLPYFDMVRLQQAARVIVTDSGGMQKEAFFYNVPCVTIRDETEWVETVELGFNRLVKASPDAILNAYKESSVLNLSQTAYPYGDGHASEFICEVLQRTA